MSGQSDLEFDVLLSFAGAERDYARAIHDIASANGVRVFLDEEFQHEIWGKNLVEYLDRTYRDRARFVAILISDAYRNRAFTRVERRAAFDRMIREANEYVLPIKVDDSWIDGLAISTGYVDLRVQGVLGVCKLLVQKIHGGNARLVVPDGVAVPRIPLGCLPGDQLATYLLELCDRPQVSVFGTLVYDERNVSVRKLLQDRDYWDGLDKDSGPNFEIFAIRDTVGEHHEPPAIEMITGTSLGRSRSRSYFYSTLLKEYFNLDKTILAYPSCLLFLVANRRVEYCRLIPLSPGSIEETYQQLSAFVSTVARSIDEAGGATAPCATLRERLDETLSDGEYTFFGPRPPVDARDAILRLSRFVER